MDLNIEEQHLCFIVDNKLIPTMHNGEQVSREGWASIICNVIKGRMQRYATIFTFHFFKTSLEFGQKVLSTFFIDG